MRGGFALLGFWFLWAGSAQGILLGLALLAIGLRPHRKVSTRA